jgi:hypothetical protein
MKRRFTIYDLRFTIWKKSAKPAAANRQSSIVNHQSQRGVALVITLIMLAVVTFMAITFLAISRRERGAVTTTTDTATARLAADDALSTAEAQIAANTFATTNPYNFGLLVSTNYVNPYGFVPNIASPTNVNYYYHGGGPVSGNDVLQLLANLYYLPRAPVWLSNTVTHVMENRFYLDLNRNGVDDPNALVTNVDSLGNVIFASGYPSTNFEVGDPEWIGVLQHPDQPYGPNNPFVARYAFVAVPVGNALDLNAIHNQARSFALIQGSDGYFRNEGVGSWEINLAAFLADLNTNSWDSNLSGGVYQYLQPAFANNGAAFNDALSLLSYRYGGYYGSLQPFPTANFYSGLVNNGIDGYTYGNPMTGLQLPFVNAPPAFNGITPPPWPGADNTNQFFDLQELFNPNEASVAFTNHLLSADNAVSTYNRYTYYRLLSQMGVESAPVQEQINLNYRNETNGVIVPNLETNLYPWTALEFFTNAADRMLRNYSQEWLVENPSNFVATFNVTNAFGLTNIPVLVSNQFVYTPAVQRVLQLAANIYDAVYYTDHFVTAGYPGAYLPSVFRPFFNKVVTGTNINVYISGYTEVFNVSEADQPLSSPYNLENPDDLNQLRPASAGPNYINVYGVPWIVGAKKGFPNFNEFAMESVFQLTRKLQVTRPYTNAPLNLYQYNQMFNVSVTNQLGVECWNSYTNDYNRPVDIYVTNYLSMTLTNDENISINLNFLQPISPISGFLPIPNAANAVWPGYNPQVNPLAAPLSFQIPLAANVAVIPTSIYRFNDLNYPNHLTTNLALPFETGININGAYPQPHWWLITTNNLQVVMVDHASGGIIDYVQLSGPNTTRDLTSEIISNYDTAAGPSGNDLWDTNLLNGLPVGLNSQMGVSLGTYAPGLGSDAWNNTDVTLRENEIDGFRAYFGLSPIYNNAGGQQAIAEASLTNAIQVPYTPSATVVQHVSWQANDPLVHYTASDLNWAGAIRLDRTADSLVDLTNQQENLGKLNQRYMPWGGNPMLPNADQNPYNLALKDPLVWHSDDWDFPTYKLPTVGWLGRVHRGTPWQTVYLKSPDILDQTNSAGVVVANTNTWSQWTGDAQLTYGQYYDAVNTAPVQDRLLFDLFTTALNDNATRGQLSVNVGASDPNNPQAGLAAWSALFSGVQVLSNNAPDSAVAAIVQHNGSLANYTPFPINPAGPAGANSAVGQIVTGINQTRTNFYFDGLQGAFEHVGDILSVPQLSDQSPFLNWNDAAQRGGGISDEMYEWLPQQAMSLLRVSGTPQSPMRYVIYCYGQALKPAANGIYTGGGSFFGMVTNYQVVAESATRAVVNFGSVVTNMVTTNVVGNWFSFTAVTNNNAQIESFNVLPPN